MLKWLQWWVCFSLLHISSIFSTCCDCVRGGTRECISILRMRHSLLHNPRRPFWSMWRMNTVPNIDVHRSINLKAYRATISSLPQQLQDPVNHSFIHMIRPAMMKNTWHLTMWLIWHTDEAIAQHAYWPPPCSIRIYRLKHQRTGGKLIQISMITTPTQWKFAGHSGYQT